MVTLPKLPEAGGETLVFGETLLRLDGLLTGDPGGFLSAVVCGPARGLTPPPRPSHVRSLRISVTAVSALSIVRRPSETASNRPDRSL